MLRERIKWQLFPGLNLHARLRYRQLPERFRGPTKGEERLVLDAGCGNGMLAYKSFLKGNRVLGVSLKEGEVVRNKRLFNEYLGIPESRLEFHLHNLYDVKALGRQFDEIICTEVLEHIDRDEEVCRTFLDILKPGGILHLCCPNAEHPDHQAHFLDESESGGHVRAGYTWDSYRALLEPIGFEVSEPIGLGGPLRQACNKRITQAQDVGRLPLGLVTFAALAPLAALDDGKPRIPYSLYVMARKPTDESNDVESARRNCPRHRRSRLHRLACRAPADRKAAAESWWSTTCRGGTDPPSIPTLNLRGSIWRKRTNWPN